MKQAEFKKLDNFQSFSEEVMLQRSEAFFELVDKRRTIREFSDKSVSKEIIINCIKAAGTSPSGANMQPWHFVVVSDKQVKKEIREGAEAEEKEFYASRAPREWLEALAPLGTDENKPFLETAPFLIAIFYKNIEVSEDGRKVKQYYAVESTGIATGILITALHQCGLATLTHTPSPMNFLNKILNRPSNEKPFLLLVTGYPAAGVKVPDIKRKAISEIVTFI
ncbi:MAG: nitroreductase family protein [Ignavibacteriales bacterium]|nr:MAG: nitroreductase family protein [Ignavibacteriales bacterium]